MGLERFIAGKLKLKSISTTVSTAVSFMLIIIAVAVASGFRKEISAAVGDMCGDFRIVPVGGLGEAGSDPVDLTDSAFVQIRGLDGIARMEGVIYRGGIIRKDEDMHGVIFRGTDSFHYADSLVAIPAKLSSLLQIGVGDKIPAYFVEDDLRVRSFVVREIYEGIVTADDKLVVNCAAGVLRKLNGWTENEASAVEVVMKESSAQAERAEMEYELNRILYENASEGRTMVCENVRTSYFQLFEWLNLIDSNVTLILVLMIIVAGFNMVTGLLIFIFNNVRAIGILKSLGMRNADISKSFLLSAGRSVATGMLAGNLVALLLCLVQKRFHLLQLNPDNYFIGFVPVNVDFTSLLACDLLSFAAIMLILVIPCFYISKIEPALSLKSDL